MGSAIGDRVLDLLGLRRARACCAGCRPTSRPPARGESLNALMALDPRVRGTLRHRLSHLLRAEGGFVTARSDAADVLVPRADAEMLLPAVVGDYTDFYASVFHATNVGQMLRPDNPLLPNYKWVPIGYHGRASSLVVSGTEIARPAGADRARRGRRAALRPDALARLRARGRRVPRPGQPARRADPDRRGRGAPVRAVPAQRLVGARRAEVGVPAARPVPGQELRDLDQPLGGHAGGARALPRRRLSRAPAGDPQPLPYLAHPEDREHGGVDLRLEVLLATKAMRERGLAPFRVSHSNLRDLYWTLAQMVAHHSSNGCNLRPGDLIASGTVSGPEPENRGCLIERTWRGKEPLALPSGEERRFLEPGDEVILRGHCERPGFARIGFGECRGVVA